MEESRLVKYINTIYFFMKLNLLMLITLILGFVIFSLEPTVKSALSIIDEFYTGAIEEKDNLLNKYIKYFYLELKEWKGNLLVVAVEVWFIFIWIISMNYESTIAAIAKYVLYYITIMSILFLFYKGMLNLSLEKINLKRGTFIEILACMFININALIKSFFIFILFLIASLYLPILNVFLTISLLSLFIFKLNNKSVKVYIKLLIDKREVSTYEK